VTLPPVVDAVVDRYLALADERLPGRITGLYLIGSVAYGDFWPKTSDVDFVAATDDRLTSDETGAVRAVHAELARQFRRPHFDGYYAISDDLRTAPDDLPPLIGVHEGAVFDGRPTVIDWGTLRTSVPVRGPVLSDAWIDPQAIKDHSRRNLAEYWRDRWLPSQRRLSVSALTSFTDWGVQWGVLGIPRLLHSMETGEVISKTASGEYALARFGAPWQRIVREALRIRHEENATSLYRTPISRRRDALTFEAHVIDAGLS
jgi:hypothetical protein